MISAPIDEVVDLLARKAPDSLARLARQYPAEADFLRLGITAGDDDKHEARGTPAERVAMKRNVAIVGLETALGVCVRLLPQLYRTLRRASAITFWGQAAATIGSASVFATLALTFPKASTYIAASLSLIGSLAALYAQYIRSGLAGGNLMEHYKVIVDAQVEAQSVLEQLRGAEGDSDLVIELVTSANVICQNVSRAEAML